MLAIKDKIIKFLTFHYLLSSRARNVIIPQIIDNLKRTDRVIDIGSGTCHVCSELLARGYTITPLDVKNRSLIQGMQSIVYDGLHIPFPDKHFDVALLLTVLHHTRNHENIINEAKRVAKKIIIIEDIYKNLFEKHLTFFFDSIMNFEFFGHPHSNRSDHEWLSLFNALNLRVISRREKISNIVFRHASYCLEEKLL